MLWPVRAVTGAGFVALGSAIGNLFTDSMQLAGALRSASQAAGEWPWKAHDCDTLWPLHVRWHCEKKHPCEVGLAASAVLLSRKAAWELRTCN